MQVRNADCTISIYARVTHIIIAFHQAVVLGSLCADAAAFQLPSCMNYPHGQLWGVTNTWTDGNYASMVLAEQVGRQLEEHIARWSLIHDLIHAPGIHVCMILPNLSLRLHEMIPLTWRYLTCWIYRPRLEVWMTAYIPNLSRVVAF